MEAILPPWYYELNHVSKRGPSGFVFSQQYSLLVIYMYIVADPRTTALGITVLAVTIEPTRPVNDAILWNIHWLTHVSWYNKNK